MQQSGSMQSMSPSGKQEGQSRQGGKSFVDLDCIRKRLHSFVELWVHTDDF